MEKITETNYYEALAGFRHESTQRHYYVIVLDTLVETCSHEYDYLLSKISTPDFGIEEREEYFYTELEEGSSFRKEKTLYAASTGKAFAYVVDRTFVQHFHFEEDIINDN